MEPKRLYRSSRSRVIGGVAGGLAEYFNIDPVIARMIFVALALIGGGGVLIYIILWIVLPEFTPIFPGGNYNAETPPTNTSNQETEPEMNKQSSDPSNRNDEEKTKGAIIAGVILITLGSLFFIDNLIESINFGDLWPILLIVIGLVIMLTGAGSRNKRNS